MLWTARGERLVNADGCDDVYESRGRGNGLEGVEASVPPKPVINVHARKNNFNATREPLQSPCKQHCECLCYASLVPHATHLCNVAGMERRRQRGILAPHHDQEIFVDSCVAQPGGAVVCCALLLNAMRGRQQPIGRNERTRACEIARAKWRLHQQCAHKNEVESVRNDVAVHNG